MSGTILEELTRELKNIKAADIMTRDVITTTEDTHLADIAELMISNRISGLPVLDEKGEQVIGLVTSNDLFIVMDMIKSGDVVEGRETAVSNPTVKFAMSTDVLKVDADTDLDEIIVIMKYKNRQTLPVYENGRMAGIIGRRDVFKHFYAAVQSLYE